MSDETPILDETMTDTSKTKRSRKPASSTGSTLEEQIQQLREERAADKVLIEQLRTRLDNYTGQSSTPEELQKATQDIRAQFRKMKQGRYKNRYLIQRPYKVKLGDQTFERSSINVEIYGDSEEEVMERLKKQIRWKGDGDFPLKVVPANEEKQAAS